MGAILQYGLSVTLVGIGTVFVGLIILIALIKLMEKVMNAATGKQKAAAPAPAPAPTPEDVVLLREIRDLLKSSAASNAEVKAAAVEEAEMVALIARTFYILVRSEIKSASRNSAYSS